MPRKNEASAQIYFANPDLCISNAKPKRSTNQQKFHLAAVTGS
jgi:hypothetical protein